MGKKVLAFDFGASSGRAMLCEINNGKLSLSEVHRFENVPITEQGHLRWNLPVLIAEIKNGMRKAVLLGGFDAVGFDTWGVDFCLLDSLGDVMENPVHYRDERGEAAVDGTHNKITQEELYSRTGIQYMPFNTVYQLSYLSMHENQKLKSAKKILLMADLFAYLLTGEMRLERTNASTTGLLNAEKQTVDPEILQRLTLPAHLFADGIDAGQIYGNITAKVCAETGCKPVPVVAVATHDTASAVVGVPTNAESVYISCGTWSLMGTQLSKSDVTDATFTNEIGYGNQIRYLKNIMGLWIIQETRRTYQMKNFSEMVTEAEKEKPFAYFIDVDDSSFLPPGDMASRVKAYCVKTGQGEPMRRGEVIRAVYESLALKYRKIFDMLCGHAKRRTEVINMVGGGIQAELLCRMTASACNVRVEAGPSEATAIGNAAVQLIALREISGLKEARNIIRESIPLKVYEPENADEWEKQYARFLKLCKQD